MNFLSFQKPSRYIDSEVNAVYKKAPVTVALAFPDIYEVGMSHLGLKILYSIINSVPYASAERVFSPWIDLGDAMKKNDVVLTSLESRRPLKDFDIVGFSLQYELSYTTVLDMLSLGGIPVRSGERLDRKDFPLVIAGGPCTANPAPMSAFIDAFLVGDAEDAVHEILQTYYSWKVAGSGDRGDLLKMLAAQEGVYVPALGKKEIIKRRIISSLDNAPFPCSPVVPYAGIIHDRVAIEIARGCSQGCRFCQAGMTYRPVRERSPETILDLAEQSLNNTGHDSISFTSLSAGDYSCLPQLLHEFNSRFAGKQISMSLPSLRVASVNREILREIRTVRKTGFTIAPEAGTERLRAVINKDFTTDRYIHALETLFQEGWLNLKLYFMTGLPTETEYDIEAIPDMVLQAIKISKKLTGRHVNISVGVSSFIPKPHTPFQWFGQNDLAVLKEKNSYLRKAFLRRGVKYKGHNEEMSLLEAVFARGDENLSGVIEAAWANGCRLDAWTETFDFGRWAEAMDQTGINAAAYARKTYELESSLPWDNISSGVSKEFLWKEYQRAQSAEHTADCREQCQSCGLKCKIDAPAPGAGAFFPGKSAALIRIQPAASVKMRLEYEKSGMARYLSHLELTTALLRAMRRAGFPLRYSGGFHPLPKISFGPALRVGVAGLREYLDMEIVPPADKRTLLIKLNQTLPGGIKAGRLEDLRGREKSLNSFIIRYAYLIKHNSENAVRRFLSRDEAIIRRNDKQINIKNMVEELVMDDEHTIQMTMCDQGEIKARLDEIIPEVFNVPVEDLDITRTAMFGWDGGWVEVMQRGVTWAAKY